MERVLDLQRLEKYNQYKNLFLRQVNDSFGPLTVEAAKTKRTTFTPTSSTVFFTFRLSQFVEPEWFPGFLVNLTSLDMRDLFRQILEEKNLNQDNQEILVDLNEDDAFFTLVYSH